MARALLEEMKDLGLTPTRFCWNSIISVHARTGNTTGNNVKTRSLETGACEVGSPVWRYRRLRKTPHPLDQSSNLD